MKNPFKKQEPAQSEENKTPEIETAVVLVQYENGGSSIGYLNVSGLKTKRQATVHDLYRMVCEVKSQIETIKTCDRFVNMMQPPRPAVKPEGAPIAEPEKKE